MQNMSEDNDFVVRAVNEYSDTIFRVAFNITQNRDDAFDVCQEVFLRLIKNSRKIKNDEHLKPWLIRTAINCSKTSVTEAFKRHRADIKEIDNLSVNGIQDDSIMFLVFKLPEKYRIVIYLYYYEEMKVAEIAKILKITSSAVKARLMRGREQLKILIEKENYLD